MKNLKFLGQWFVVLMTDGQEVNDLCKENVFFFIFFPFNPLFSYVHCTIYRPQRIYHYKNLDSLSFEVLVHAIIACL